MPPFLVNKHLLSATTENVAIWAHRTRLRDCSPNGGTTDEKRPSFQLRIIAIGLRKRRRTRTR